MSTLNAWWYHYDGVLVGPPGTAIAALTHQDSSQSERIVARGKSMTLSNNFNKPDNRQ